MKTKIVFTMDCLTEKNKKSIQKELKRIKKQTKEKYDVIVLGLLKGVK